MTIKLEKINNKIYLIDENNNKIELKVNKQASKGEGKEVVDIEKYVGNKYQKWVSLSRLVEGENIIELKPRKEISIEKYELTKEEQEEVDALQSRINEIIENAKKRFVPKLDFKKMSNQAYINSLSEQQRNELIELLSRKLGK